MNKRLLDLLRKARSLKKSSFFISPKNCCLCLRVHCLIDGILLFCVHTHLAFFFYIVAYCLCSRCRCTIHSVRLPHVSARPFLWATGGTEYIFIFCIKTHRSVLFVVTPSSCCPYNVQSERLLQVSAGAFLGRASTRMPTVHSSKFCFHIILVCLWPRRPCHIHRERLPHMSVCVCTSWAKLDENADDIYFSSVFIHIVAYYRSVLFVVALSR